MSYKNYWGLQRGVAMSNMDSKVDMHLHTSHSDGFLTPKQVVEYCHKKGIIEMAITDHDTVKGVLEGKFEAEKMGIKFHTGVEISAHMQFNDQNVGLHLLGYDIDIENKMLGKIFKTLKENRDETNEKIFKQVGKDFGLSKSEIINSKNTSYIGKPDIGRILVEKGMFKNLQEAFDKYFDIGKIADIKRKSIRIEDAVNAVIDSGGFPVLAHPAFIKIGERGSEKRYNSIEKIVDEVKSLGVIGIEALYLKNTMKETKFLCELAQRKEMVITKGSDYHG